MKFADIADAQQKAFAAFEKRLESKPTPALAASLGKEAFGDRVSQIEKRIDRLELQKKSVVARIDEALKGERDALVAIRAQARVQLEPLNRGKSGSAPPPTQTKTAAPAKAAPGRAAVAKSRAKATTKPTRGGKG